MSRPTPRTIGDLIAGDRSMFENALKDASGKRILLATSMGSYQHGTMMETVLAAALTLRGARVEVLLCDAALPCCQMTKMPTTSPGMLLDQRPLPRCEKCIRMGREAFAPLGIPIRLFSDYITDDDKNRIRAMALAQDICELRSFRHDGMAIGEHALAGALRFFARGDLEGEERNEEVVRLYLESSLLTATATQRLLDAENYDAACFHHGIYSPQGIIGEVCRKRRLRLANWNPAYKNSCFIFSHNDTYHHTMITEPVSAWNGIPWDGERARRTMEYLDSRRRGTNDWIWFHEHPDERAATQFDPDKPLISLLTNVVWDAQLHYESNAYPDMAAWVMDTIRWFADHPELQLAIRIHPAEIRGFIPSRQPMAGEIDRHFQQLPPNVLVLGPEDPTSTYGLMEASDAVLIYNTKAGIEASAKGIPVVVAGEAWIRGKGFSMDASSPEDYIAFLGTLPLKARLSQDKHLLALKYAFHFFFRRMIPVPFIEQFTKATFTLNAEDLSPLLPGATPGLDVICNGILTGSPFIHPAENEDTP